MTDVTTSAEEHQAPSAGLVTRLIGVIFSPRDAYTAVANRPRALGAMVVAAVLIAGIQGIFFSTQVGKDAYVTQALNTMKAVGVTVTDQMVQTIEAQAPTAAIRQTVSVAIFMPLLAAMVAGLLLAVFTAVLGGGASYKQVFAVVAHSMIISALAQAFSFPIMYFQGEMTSPTRLSVFFPMLPEQGFFTYLLSALDLFYFWWLFNMAIGVAVLYKRRTGPVASLLLGIYAVIAVIIAAVRAF
ncbi:MAG TPA: YIP1 family protein [Vicinamibacterales bacterium]|jgi:hypothetical protein|nr:YIP1 family protein [Vicinamibacterales bacterium]